MDVDRSEDSTSISLSVAGSNELGERDEEAAQTKFRKPLLCMENYSSAWDEHALVKGFAESMKLCQVEGSNSYDPDSTSSKSKDKSNNLKKGPARGASNASGSTADVQSTRVFKGRKSRALEGRSESPYGRNEPKRCPSDVRKGPPAWFDEETSSLLISWYMAGYYSGQYAARQEEISRNAHPD